MKMLKKAASVALASALVFSLAACGNNGGGSEGSTDEERCKIGGYRPTPGEDSL